MPVTKAEIDSFLGLKSQVKIWEEQVMHTRGGQTIPRFSVWIDSQLSEPELINTS